MNRVFFFRIGLVSAMLGLLCTGGCKTTKKIFPESIPTTDQADILRAEDDSLYLLNPVSPVLSLPVQEFSLPEDFLLREVRRDSIPSRAYYGDQWDTRDIRARKTYSPSGTVVLNLLPFSSDVFTMPCQGKIISEFGIRSGRVHTGDDIKQSLNDSIVAAFDGVVRMARTYSGYGKLVVVRHYNGLETVYSHLNQIKVKINDRVKSGDLVGLAGRTGRATTVHLHFEVRFRGEVLNPRLLIDFDRGVLHSGHLVLTPASFRAYGKNIPKQLLASETPSEKTVPAGGMKAGPSLAAGSSSLPLESKAVPANQAAVSPKVHVIQKGETLFQLSKKYGTTVALICQVNGITAGKTLRIGEKIVLP